MIVTSPLQQHAFRNLAGMRFGRLTVVCVHHWKKNKRWWVCKCDCGTEKVVRSDGLTGGDNVSCGCKKVEQLTIHGATGTPEHKIWLNMIERCHWPDHKMFVRYGGRGISVCDEWRNSFSAFFTHVGARPTPQHSIDRINNDGGYEPGNVRWATKKQQSNNRRNTLFVDFNGQRKSLAEWCVLIGTVSRATAYERIRRGWLPENAISTPQRRK